MAISANTPEQMLASAEEAIGETPFVELRLDSLDKPASILNKLKDFIVKHPLVTVIGTCRRKPNGGSFTGTIADEMHLLEQAAQAGCHIIDVEIETAETLKPEDLDLLRQAGSVVMISFHDFSGTPDLDAVYERMVALGPDYYKIVSTAQTLADNLKILSLLEKHADNNRMVGMAMGERGLPSRLLGPRFGSLFTFASLQAGEETAPGQVTSRTMTELYRVNAIDSSTRIYGVAGSPVSSSLSPLMLNTGFRRETVNAVYMALDTPHVDDLLKLVAELPVHGLSVTMPLKEDILPHLVKTDPLSAKIGACNTLVRAQDGKLYGFNTDVGGIVGPLERRLQLRGAKVLVLGAGGAARAAVFGLKDRGADVFILSRTEEKAQTLARQANAKVQKRDQLAKTQFDVIINATPYGMVTHKGESPIAPEEFHCRLFFDLVYNPLETPLIRLARSKSIPVILGVEMFVQQGARQFEIWTGKPAPQEEMLRVVLHALRQSAGPSAPMLASVEEPETMNEESSGAENVAEEQAPVVPPVRVKSVPAKPAQKLAAPSIAVKATSTSRQAAPEATRKNVVTKASTPAKQVKAAPVAAKKTATSSKALPVTATPKSAQTKKAAPKKQTPVAKKAVVVKKTVAKKPLPVAKKAAKVVAKPAVKKAPPAKKAGSKKAGKRR